MNDCPAKREKRSVAVIGGGITGMAAAYELAQHGDEVRFDLYEASDRLGGAIWTEEVDDWLVEMGPDMFTTKEPFALDLCRRLGFEEQLIGTRTERRGAYIVRRGKLIPVPSGMALMAPQKVSTILASPLLSWSGKSRLLCEAVVPRMRNNEDESLERFARRRFGTEVYEWLIQPLVSGIYTADPTTLSMQATMSEFLEMEQQHGSLIRAALKKRRELAKQGAGTAGARYGLFMAPKAGMGELIRTIHGHLPQGSVRMKTPVTGLERLPESGGWQLNHQAGSDCYDHIIICTRAFDAARLVESESQALSEQLQAIEYASTAVAVLVAPRDQISHEIDAFGFVVPLAEQRQIIAGSFANHKFEGRAPDDHVIMRVFIGGACQADLLQQTDEELIQLAKDELKPLIGLRSDAVRFSNLVRWNQAMPQYTLGHLNRVAHIEELSNKIEALELAGNAYRGVGIPACIRSGQLAAQRALEMRLENSQ